ncbi:hypothetical protein CYMTET_56551 [Cymbomonas tetramitiformis]|uniref:RRM domain-containing protein n=1 Tax=Cymbomonas tetramitiformis TaxID=36881 RepID=A0AAE0BBX2_9CHLO|nr:hypothetical protein CYMTET_56551 [Cymbomonas tetramitiformis]
MNVSLNPKTTVYVGGLEKNINEAILHAAFIPFGDIKDVNIPLDQTTQENRGFGFVTYLEKPDAAAAMDNMHNAELYGRVLRVNFAQPMKIKARDQGWSHQPVWADADSYMEKQIQDEEYKDAVLEEEYGLQNKAADSKGDDAMNDLEASLET